VGDTISFIIPSIGRPSLNLTLRSLTTWPGDEVLVIQHNPPSGNWGNAERQEGQDRARGDYLAFIDDDDVYVPNHRQIMATAIAENPGKPIVFRIQYPNGDKLWQPSRWRGRPPRIKNGNISSQMFLFPNDKTKLAKWVQLRTWRGRGADTAWIAWSGWGNRYGYVWRDEVIVLMGHDDPYVWVNNRGRIRPGVWDAVVKEEP
jgi:glycosyltransferase involved in cell wall biosynthesis